MTEPKKLRQSNRERVVAAVQEYFVTGMREQMSAFRDAAVEMSGREKGIRRDSIMKFRQQAEPIIDCMLDTLHQNFDPDAAQQAMQATVSFTLEDLRLQDIDSVDESIALSKISDRTELLYEYQLWDMRQRTAWWINEDKAPISDKSLAPYALCKAFLDSLSQCGVSAPMRLVLLTQFDRQVLRKLHELYDGLPKIFDQHGFEPQQVISRPQANATRSANDNEQAGDETHQASSPGIDPQTWEMLSRFNIPQGIAASGNATTGHGTGTGTGTGTSYSDNQLAQDLSSLLSGGQAKGWEGINTQSLNASASAIGRAFNQLVTDPYVSRTVQPQFNELRFGVLKSALADPQFFSNPDSQSRALLDELATLATTSRLFSKDDLARFNQMLAGMQKQFEVDAHDVRDTQLEQDPISDESLNAFLNKQIEKQKARRKDLVEKASQVVSEELWLQTANRRCSESLKQALSASWEPMMALRLLRHGVNSKLWDRGINLLRRIIDAADPADEDSTSDNQIEYLLNDLADELSSVGMLTERIARLRQTLADCLHEMAQTPAQATTLQPPPSNLDIPQDDLLSTIVVKGSWFEVLDRASDTVRWLQATGMSTDGLSVHFVAFREKDELTVPAADFIEDLKSGASAPINPRPKARAALKQL